MKRLCVHGVAMATLIAATAAKAYDDNPYGVVSHTAWSNKDEPVETIRMMGACHLGWNRVDCAWPYVEPYSNRWDFTAFQTVVDLCARENIKVLPILSRSYWGTNITCPKAYEGEGAVMYQRYVREVVRRFGAQMPVIEVVNEPNGNMPPAHYAKQLKATYETIKAVNPKVTVAFAGTAPSPCGFVEAVYRELGGKPCYDIMNIHPYTTSFRNRPEGELEGEIAKIRKVMADHGDGAKPLWITELGWASHSEAHIQDDGLIRKGLALLRPGKTDWNVVYAGISGAERDLDLAVAEGPLAEVLPPGAKVTALAGEALRAALAGGTVDVVVYPFREGFPVATHDAVHAFVKRGGILVDMGGSPMYYGMVPTKIGSMTKASQHYPHLYRQLHFGVAASWIDKRYPAKAYLSDGRSFEYYLTRDALAAGDEFIPLASSSRKLADGGDIVSCAAIRLDSDLKGGLLLGTFALNAGENRNSEQRQALMLPRAIMIALQSGVEKFFWYEFHAREGDIGDQESHFGIIRKNHVPKPAFATYKTLIDRRPAGSTACAGTWKYEDDTLYCPQWTRPDNLPGGAIWTIGKPGRRLVRFTRPDDVQFHNVQGMRVWFERAGDGFKLPLSDSPIYFAGGQALLPPDAAN